MAHITHKYVVAHTHAHAMHTTEALPMERLGTFVGKCSARKRYQLFDLPCVTKGQNFLRSYVTYPA